VCVFNTYIYIEVGSAGGVEEVEMGEGDNDEAPNMLDICLWAIAQPGGVGEKGSQEAGVDVGAGRDVGEGMRDEAVQRRLVQTAAYADVCWRMLAYADVC
jgi:hypothetical protein